jgi:integrase/recombinase XerD
VENGQNPDGSNLKMTNLNLIRGYLTYLRVEKGLRPLTCEAYQRDLLQCAEFLEKTNGFLASAKH